MSHEGDDIISRLKKHGFRRRPADDRWYYVDVDCGNKNYIFSEDYIYNDPGEVNDQMVISFGDNWGREGDI